jgi:hypothetical protein
MILDTDVPTIFPKTIVSALIKRNRELFPPFGLSVIPAEIISKEEANNHRQLIAQYLGFKPEEMKYQKQTHSAIVREIDIYSLEIESDAMITNQTGIALCVKIADCCAILVYDPIHRAIAAIHSGWKGTRQNIVKHTIEKLQSRFGSKPSDLLVYVSACASAANYEVGDNFEDYFPDSVQRLNGKLHFDNRKEIRSQLIKSGVNPTLIEVSEKCTIADDSYHSFRRDGVKSGRMLAVIGMRN